VASTIDRLWREGSHLLPPLFSSPPQILGIIEQGDSAAASTALDPSSASLLPSQTNFWLRLISHDGVPHVQEITVCSHRQFPSSHVFIYDENAAQAAAIVASCDSFSATDYGAVMKQMAARASILVHLDAHSHCSWMPPSPPPQIEGAALPPLLRFVVVCTAVLVTLINSFAALFPRFLTDAVRCSHIGQLLCQRCSGIVNSPFIMPVSPSVQPSPLVTRRARHRLQSFCLLLLIDFALGFLWVFKAPAALAAAVQYFGPAYRYTLGASGVAEHIKYWLMGNPAGLKLNGHLSATAANLCIHLLDLWLHAQSFIGDSAAAAAAAMLRWGGCLGLSFTIACALDISNIACAWVLFLNAAFRKSNSSLTSVASSLFRLFRGKKWNPLRHRVDSCDASVDQWLLGTLAFSVLLFLMPTIVSFHLFFAITRSILRIAQLPLEFLQHLLTETPVYPLLCKLLWPQQLCCSLFLRNISASATNQLRAGASCYASAAVFALDTGCEGWADVLSEVSTTAKQLVVLQLLRIKVSLLC
jgi:hypothetical protein